MAISQISHVAIGVRDMERALAFWRDFLGLGVSVDHIEEWASAGIKRRAVYLRWGEGVGSSYVVLGQDLDRTPFGQPAELNQVGIHHFAFDVDDCDLYVARGREMGIEAASRVYDYDAVRSGEPDGGAIRTVLFRDPDGNFVQLHQWLVLHPKSEAGAQAA